MNYNLDNNDELISFFNEIFEDINITSYAPNIIKFFIMTRNYGLINYADNINKLVNGTDVNKLALEVIKDGFSRNNIPFDKHNLIALLIRNYHQNGFYFHSFPGVYEDVIRQNGLLASGRNNGDDRYFQLINKYNFGGYFSKSENRVCVTEKLSVIDTHGFALETPEWLNQFLKLGCDQFAVDEAFKNGDIPKLMELATQALLNMRIDMMKNPNYDPDDYSFLKEYITNIIQSRFRNGNDKVGIALIEKQKSEKYFGDFPKDSDISNLEGYVNATNSNENRIIQFIVDDLSNGEKNTEESIPSDLIRILSYRIRKISYDYEDDDHKTGIY